MFFMVPFLLFLFSFLVLVNAGRNLKEKLTIFLVNPENTGEGSSDLMTALRAVFWVSLFICLWLIISIIRHKG